MVSSVVEHINTGTLPADCPDYFNGKFILFIKDNSHKLDISKTKRMAIRLNITNRIGACSYVEIFSPSPKFCANYIFGLHGNKSKCSPIFVCISGSMGPRPILPIKVTVTIDIKTKERLRNTGIYQLHGCICRNIGQY